MSWNVREIFDDVFGGGIAYACSVCGKGAFDRPGSVCAECQETEAA
jgi:hypothetical protein